MKFSLSRFAAYLISVATIVILLSPTIFNPAVGRGVQASPFEGEVSPLQTQDIEIVAEFPLKHPPGNIAVTPQGRLIMSQHQFYGAPLRVVEVMDDGTVAAFPNETWSSEPNSNGACNSS